MELYVCGLVALAIGFLIGLMSRFPAKPDGKMVLDETNPDKDVYSLELTIPIDDIPKRKTITLTIEKLRK